MKKILFPTDFSPCAQQAEDLAIDLATKYVSELHVFHSVQSPVDWVKLDISEEHKYPEIVKRIKEARSLMDELEKKHKKLIIRSFIGFNAAHEDILSHAEENNIDLIVMGSHGESGFQSLALGENAKKVLDLSKIPVLIAKHQHM